MSNLAISVENLGKCYQIGERERYYALRDSLTNIVKYPFKKITTNGNIGKKFETEYIWALKDINFEICRENSEGLYTGSGWLENKGNEEEAGYQVMKCTYKAVID